MGLIRLKQLVQGLSNTPARVNTQYEVYKGDEFICEGSFRHWKSNELRDFRLYSVIAMQNGYEVTTWQDKKPVKEQAHGN